MNKPKTMAQIIRKRRFHFVSPDETARKACKVMNNRKLGAVPVVDADNNLLGMISERDIVRRCIGERRRTALTPISEVMTQNPVFGDPDDTVIIAMAKMMQNHIRHLPIVKDGKVLGCISIREVINELSYMAMKNLGMVETGLKELETA
ncbi:CBS domain-containing protein [Thalassovita gelatinovora]|nr:CBS domain-containing protein [Thalassovita gelatinovora]QIZ80354.1 CBS domain-containing protein [Thalassovita gelatinovora]